MACKIDISRTLAPEDIQRGQYICALREFSEFPPFCLNIEPYERTQTPLRIPWLPHPAGVPLKVLEVCLPFVLVRTPEGKVTSLDVRRYEFAALSGSYAEKAFTKLGNRKKRKRRKHC